MTRETKAGLLMILMLGGVFGFMVYKRLHQPSTALAQQNPPTIETAPAAESQEDPSTGAANDPFLSGADELTSRAKVVPASAATPAALDRRTARDEKKHREDDRTIAQVVPTKPKPRLPTRIPDEEEAIPIRRAAPASAVRTVSEPVNEPAASGIEETDPFGADTVQRGAPTESGARSAAVVEFEDLPPRGSNSTSAPVETGAQSNSAGSELELGNTDPFPSQPAGRSDGFEPPVVRKPAPIDEFPEEPRRPADRTEPAPTESLEFPEERSSPSFDREERPAQPRGFDASEQNRPREVEFETRNSAAPAAVLDSGIEELDTPPARSSVPSLKIPSRDTPPARATAQADERFGGYRPAAPESAEAFPAEDRRPARASEPISEDPVPRRAATRPAPVTQIDEDFGARPTTRPLVAGDTYQIEPNDNYWTISRKKYGTGRYFMALAQHNANVIPDPKRMRPGVMISTPTAEALDRTYASLIPKAGTVDPVQTASVSTTASARSTPAAEPEGDAGFFLAADGAPMYRVGQEDTLSGIAQRHLGRSSRWVQVFEMNRDVLTDGNTLKIGAILRLPADASRVEVVGGSRTFR